MTPVYNWYSASCVANPTKTQCSNRELAFVQWANGQILSNPTVPL